MDGTMKIFDELNSENFVLYASRHYQNSQCTGVEEFYEDLQRFKYLKRLFSRYEIGDLQERLILNHLIVVYNVFGISHANRMIFYKIEKKHWPALKPFLVFLNYLREDEYVDVSLDVKIVDKLRGL
jgi:hypothetical protein|tara:strand:- start:415 stop:792 length:378 start_codon:yes stop_codon:yes gene_type:complete